MYPLYVRETLSLRLVELCTVGGQNLCPGLAKVFHLATVTLNLPLRRSIGVVMHIIASEVSLASSHSFSRIESTTERLETSARTRGFGGERDPGPAASQPGENAVNATLSIEGRALAAAERASGAIEGAIESAVHDSNATIKLMDSAAEDALKDPENQLLIALVEYLTGKPMQILDRKDGRGAEGQLETTIRLGATNSNALPRAEGNQAPGVTLRYERMHSLAEHESTQFSAQGVVQTAEGKRIGFAVAVAMQRTYREESQLDIQTGPAARREDPLVINFAGKPAQLQDQRFEFDLDADGEPEALPLLASGSGFLVFDRNGDGVVNDGKELFGALSGDGYADLKTIDEDGNDWIDAADSASEQLYLWLSGDRDRLLTLEEAGVAAVSTSNVSTPFELRGQQNTDLGAVRSMGLYLSTNEAVGTTQQVDLSV